MKSIITDRKECYVCGTTYNLHEHHIFEGTGKRKISEREGLKLWLCGRHHNLSKEGVHFNKELDKELKVLGETKWCEINNKTPEDFIKIIGRNYL